MMCGLPKKKKYPIIENKPVMYFRGEEPIYLHFLTGGKRRPSGLQGFHLKIAGVIRKFYYPRFVSSHKEYCRDHYRNGKSRC